jgi:hypothetical protein
MWLADHAYEKHDVTYATPLFFFNQCTPNSYKCTLGVNVMLFLAPQF